MLKYIKTVPVGFVGYWRKQNGEPTIRKARFVSLKISNCSGSIEVRYRWNIAGIGVIEQIETGLYTKGVGHIFGGYIYMTYDGADIMDKADCLSNRVESTKLRDTFTSYYYDSIGIVESALTFVFKAWRLNEKTNLPQSFIPDVFIETGADGRLVGRIPSIDNGEAFATEEECLANRDKCELVDFDDEGDVPTDAKPSKLELLNKWLEDQHMALCDLRDIINDDY